MVGADKLITNLIGIGGFLILYEYNNDKCAQAECPPIATSNLFSLKPSFFYAFFILFITVVISSSIL